MSLIKKKIYTSALCLAVVVFFLGNMVSGENKGNEAKDSKTEVITIVGGESTIVKTPWPAARVAVTDNKIANVQVLTPDQLLVQGLKIGSTDLIAWSEGEKKTQQWKVKVIVDIEDLKGKLNILFPSNTIELTQSGETLVINGSLRSADQAAQLHNYFEKSGISYVDMTGIAGVQQVKLEVRVAEVSRKASRALGMNSYFGFSDGGHMNGALLPGPTTSPITGASPFPTPTPSPFPGFGQQVTSFVRFPQANMAFLLVALAENQYLRVLASPTLVALSGEEASFLAGGEYPIPVVQGGGGGVGTDNGNSISVEYKEYGVKLKFRPVVLGDGTIRLYAAPEVSELSEIGAVVVDNFVIPALVVRRAETTLELKSGQTFAMAGLLKNNVASASSRTPGLGDLPILGTLFRSVRYQDSDTEMVVLVTASLVEPMSTAKKPPLPGFLYSIPNDWEFYIDGRLMGQAPAKIDPDSASWLKQAGLEGLVGPGAWDSYDSQMSTSKADVKSSE